MTYCEPQTEAEFYNFYNKAEYALVIYGDSSVNCNAMYEIFKIVSAVNPLIFFIKADVNKLKTCAEVMAIKSLPTCIALKNRVQIDIQVGVCTQARLLGMCSKLK